MQGMYRIVEREKKIRIVCKHCSDRGYVAKGCNKCGGAGTHNKTIKFWEVAKRLVDICRIDRVSYDEVNGDGKGELRYWTSMSEYYPEKEKRIHFSYKDAQREADYRNILNVGIDLIKNIKSGI